MGMTLQGAGMAGKTRANVIGIDFGTSNTYLTICPYGTKNKFPLHIGGRSPAIDTAILYADDPGPDPGLFPLVGERATATFGQADLETRARRGYRYHANFKPEIVGHEVARKCAADFLGAIRREAQIVGVGLDQGEGSVIIGAPSEAGPAFRETLRAVVGEAGLGAAEVVDEPKGVLLTDLGYNRFPLGDILDGYLVVDFGGGTCDFALMSRGEVVASWGDMELGGRLFDDLFFQWFLEQNPGAEEALARERREFYVWSYCCRRLKEDFSETVARDRRGRVTAEVGRFGVVRELDLETFLARASAYTPSEAFASFGRTMGVRLSPRLLGGGIDLIAWFRDLLLGGLGASRVRAVSLSGGSSRWFFVMDLCLSALGLRPGRILGSPNPFGAISEGLAILPAVKMELEAAKEKMLADKEGFIVSELMPLVEENLGGSAECLAGRITAELFDGQIVPLLRRAGDEGLRIADVEAGIQGCVDQYRERLEELADEEIGSGILATRTILQDKVQAWLDSYGLRLEGRLPAGAGPSGLVEIGRPTIGDQLSRPLVTVSAGLVATWTGLILASLCGGGGVALLAAGPLGLVLGGLGGFGLGHLGLRPWRGRIERMAKDVRLPAAIARAIVSEKNVRRAREGFRSDLVAKVNEAYGGISGKLPAELDAVIAGEINQLGIINVF
jgi:hypothetical protein